MKSATTLATDAVRSHIEAWDCVISGQVGLINRVAKVILEYSSGLQERLDCLEGELATSKSNLEDLQALNANR